MSEILLTQKEANTLIKMDKTLVKNQQLKLPIIGSSVEIPLRSKNQKENFILNYWRGSINLSKRNHHFRKQTIGLVRLDIGHPHRNPNGKEVGWEHLHLYKEGYNRLQWAYDIPKKQFSSLKDVETTIIDFLKYIHVINLPDIQRGLFR